MSITNYQARKVTHCHINVNVCYWPRLCKNAKNLKFSWVGLPFPTLRKSHSERFERPIFLFAVFPHVFTQPGPIADVLKASVYGVVTPLARSRQASGFARRFKPRD